MAELTYDQVEKAAKAGARAAIMEEVKKDNGAGGEGLIYGLVEELVAKAFGPEGSYYEGAGVYERFAETTYEQVGKVLDERGFPKK